MQPNNRFFDDLARVTSGAMGAVAGVRAEVEALFRSRFERLLADMDLVKREEFEAVRAMAAKARAEQEDLLIRMAALETRLRDLEAAPAPVAMVTAAERKPRRRVAKPAETP